MGLGEDAARVINVVETFITGGEVGWARLGTAPNPTTAKKENMCFISTPETYRATDTVASILQHLYSIAFSFDPNGTLSYKMNLP